MFLKSIRPIFFTLLLLLMVSPSNSNAGPYTDELSKCIITSTTTNDREEVIKWMFSAISLHPVVDGMSLISKEQMDNISKTTAKIFERLMTEDCLKQTKEAIEYEGSAAVESSFNLFGQVAAKEIFQHKNVTTALSDLEKYFDTEKLKNNLKSIKK